MRVRSAVLAFSVLFAGAMSQASVADAGERMTYQPAGFQAAQDAGKPILVDIAASWCPVCKAQKPIIDALAAKPEFADLVIFEVDFDSQKDVVRGFGARSQSTLIAYRGTEETGRSVGDTNPASVEALVSSAFAD